MPVFYRDLMSDDLDLLREIIAQGGKTSGLIDPSGYQRLVDAGWLNAVSKSANDVSYEVTRAGRLVARSMG
jgi:hypothetical protein